MSLINDALKRTKQAQQQRQPAAPVAPVTPSPSPVEATPPGVAWLFPAAVTLLVAVACFFIGFAFFAVRKPAEQVILIPQKISPAAPVMQKTPPSPPATTIAVAAPKPAPPILKVEGIFYNDTKWQAIVNGQSVFVGDEVNGFRVELISKNSVSFAAPDGTEKTLALGD